MSGVLLLKALQQRGDQNKNRFARYLGGYIVLGGSEHEGGEAAGAAAEVEGERQ